MRIILNAGRWIFNARVAVIGTVGVPANYGGFETLAENLLTYKKDKSIEYRIFCSSKHYNKKLSTYKGAILTYVPLEANGIILNALSPPYSINLELHPYSLFTCSTMP